MICKPHQLGVAYANEQGLRNLTKTGNSAYNIRSATAFDKPEEKIFLLKPLARRSYPAFKSYIRERGEGYFKGGYVKAAFLHPDNTSAYLLVQGSYKYKIYFEWDEDSIRAFCSCPYFNDGLLCKHIWASILHLDAKHVHRLIPGETELEVIPDSHLPGKYRSVIFSPLDVAAGLAPFRGATTPEGPASENFIWKKQILKIQNDLTKSSDESEVVRGAQPRRRMGFYLLNLEAAKATGKICVEFWAKELAQNSVYGSLKKSKISESDIPFYDDPKDREILSLLIPHGRNELERPHYYSYSYQSERHVEKVTLSHPETYELILQKIFQTERFFLKKSVFQNLNSKLTPLFLDFHEPWGLNLKLEVKPRQGYKLIGQLTRGGEILSFADISHWFAGGYFLSDNKIHRLQDKEHQIWAKSFERQTEILIPEKDIDSFSGFVYSTSALPPIEMPVEIRWPTVTVAPEFRLLFRTRQENADRKGIFLDVEVNYAGHLLFSYDKRERIIDHAEKRIIARNFAQEESFIKKLKILGAVEPLENKTQRFSLVIGAEMFLPFVQDCLKEGLIVLAEGKQIRASGAFNMSISMGVDWFDLSGGVEFDKKFVALPDLIQAMERGENFVVLGGDEIGILPKEWLKKYASLMAMGDVGKSSIRFKSAQGFLLDSWLADEKSLETDTLFEHYRRNLRSCIETKEVEAPRGFQGQLRSYQKVGLGWLHSLRKIGMGGILADDMGLGKTIQILGFLESQRLKSEQPSLVVAPKSLIFNWLEEASRFTPKLKVLNYTGLDRHLTAGRFSEYDVILTTYHTMRIDIEFLKTQKFNCIVIDEAQAIKNPTALNTKASLLLNGEFKLALTGTPVENSVQDLFSILNFANPGLISEKVQSNWIQKGYSLEKESAQLLANAFKPLILRRTKSQVLKDLPEKTEQILYCELGGKQKKDYERLRDFYKVNLTKKIATDGLGKSKIKILTALLRLRQTACHPGLVDKARIKENSAKLDVLIEQLKELTSENHKALIFSQFTSFLSIVKHRLDEENIKYLYLDGKTKNRKECVERFQNDESIPLFLLSLKAGGAGLNLTAADYVFILDPWWNPAVEAQAIDRTHRIGQKNKVMAYKFIAKNTVEEKILDLQKSKKGLFDSIVISDESLLKKMSLAELQTILS